VKLENLEGHVQRVHPGQDVDTSLTKEERRALARPSPRAGRPQVSRSGRTWIVVLVVIVVAVLAFALIYRPGGTTPSGTAPDFTITATTGGDITLSSLRGQVVFLDFMDTDCHFCQEHTGTTMVPLHNQWGNQVFFLSIDVGWVPPRDDTVADVEAFKTQYGSTWTYALDPDNVHEAYGVTGTPTQFLIDKDGNIAGDPYGATSTISELSSAISALVG
jgi:peroxiredoxin